MLSSSSSSVASTAGFAANVSTAALSGMAAAQAAAEKVGLGTGSEWTGLGLETALRGRFSSSITSTSERFLDPYLPFLAWPCSFSIPSTHLTTPTYSFWTDSTFTMIR